MSKEWIPDLPSEWEHTQIRHVARVFAGGTPDRKNSAYWDNGLIPWLNSGTVNQDRIVEPSEFVTDMAASTGATRWVRKGSVVVALAGQGKTKGMAARTEISATLNQSLAAIEPGPQLHYRFLHYWLKANHRNLRGLAGGDLRDGLNLDHIGSVHVPLPPMAEQRLIADYLDRETAEIDAFIADLRLLEEITHERYEREWSEAFTSASLYAAMRVKFLVSSLVDGPFGSALTSSHYSDEGSPVVRLGNIGRNEFALEPRVYIPDDYARQLASHAVEPGDVVIAGLGDLNHPLGRAAVVPSEFGVGIVKADCYRARPNHHVTSEYLAWALSSPPMNDHFREIGRGSTRVRLNLGIVGNSPIPVPPIVEQRKIIESSRLRSAERDSAIELIESAISLAQERRSSLISAAVTGQIDVTAQGVSAAEQLRDELEVHV